MLQIDSYNEKDLSAIVSLSVRAWAPVFESLRQVLDPQVFSHFYPHWQEAQAKAVEAACSASDMTVWTARDGDSIVGFVAAKLHRDSGMGEIYMVAVEPAHQCKGIGGTLTDRASIGCDSLAWLSRWSRRVVTLAMNLLAALMSALASKRCLSRGTS